MNRLIVSDRPLGFWLFYCLFILGGMFALILVAAVPPDKMTAVIVSFIGIGNIAGGLYMIRREPASVLIFDPESERLMVRRRYPIGRRVSCYPLSAVSSAEVETKEHTEGGHVYRPLLRLNESESVPVSLFWYQTRQKSEETIGEIGSFLNLPADDR